MFATVENVLAAWADPGVGWAAAGGSDSDVDVRKWLTGDNTIYVVAAPFEQDRLRPVLTRPIGLAHRAGVLSPAARAFVELALGARLAATNTKRQARTASP